MYTQCIVDASTSKTPMHVVEGDELSLGRLEEEAPERAQAAKVQREAARRGTFLAQAGAPPDVLMVLLSLVETNEERLETAKKVGLASVVVDVLVAMKDRQGLLQHKASLVASSEDWLYAENALKNSVKWKN